MPVTSSVTLCFTVRVQGILGTVNSGKSALVHRYLTGSYMQEESPEGWLGGWLAMGCEVVLTAFKHVVLIK